MTKENASRDLRPEENQARTDLIDFYVVVREGAVMGFGPTADWARKDARLRHGDSIGVLAKVVLSGHKDAVGPIYRYLTSK